MRTVSWMVAGLAALVVTATPAQSQKSAKPDPHKTAVEQIGEAITIVSICQALELDATAITLAANRAKMNLDELLPEAGAFSATLMDGYRQVGEKKICELGMFLYGPQGKNMPNFVAPK